MDGQDHGEIASTYPPMSNLPSYEVGYDLHSLLALAVGGNSTQEVAEVVLLHSFLLEYRHKVFAAHVESGWHIELEEADLDHNKVDLHLLRPFQEEEEHWHKQMAVC